MSPKQLGLLVDYAPTKEQLLESEREAGDRRIQYARQKLFDARPVLAELVRQSVAPRSKSNLPSTQLNYVNGAAQLHLKHPSASVRLEMLAPRPEGDPELIVMLWVNRAAESVWRIRINPRTLPNPLICEYFDSPDWEKYAEEGLQNLRKAYPEILSTGTNLKLNGLTDKSTQRRLAITDHICATVNRRYKEL